MQENKKRLKYGPSYSTMLLLIFISTLLAGILLWELVNVNNLYKQGQTNLNEIKTAFKNLEKYSNKESFNKDATVVIQFSETTFSDNVDTNSKLIEIMQAENSRSLSTINNYLVIFSILITVVTLLIPIFNYFYIQNDQIKRINSQYENSKELLNQEIQRMKKSIEQLNTISSRVLTDESKEDSKAQAIPSISESPEDRAAASAISAQLNVNTTNYKEALKEISEAIVLNPNNSEYYILRGEINLKLGNKDEAIDDATHLIQTNPDNAYYFNLRGHIFYTMGNFEQAIEDFDKAISFSPNEGTYYFNKANALNGRSKYSEALVERDKAIKIKPDISIYYYGRGLDYFGLKNFTKALEDLNMAISLDETNVKAYQLRVRVNTQLGNLEEAVKDAKKVEELLNAGKKK